MSSAAMVSRRMRLPAKAMSRDRLVEVVADHQHIQVFFQRVHREGSRRVGGGRQDVLLAADLEDVRGMSAACAFGVKRVDRAAFPGRDGVFHEPAFVQRVGVDHHLHVHVVGNRKATVDGCRCRAPVLMQLERAGACLHHLDQPVRPGSIALSGKPKVDWKGFRCLHHALDVPGAGRTCSGVGSGRRSGTAAQHGRNTGIQRIIYLLRTNEMNMRIKTAGSQ